MKNLHCLRLPLLLGILVSLIAACRIEDDKDVVVTIPPEYRVDVFQDRAPTDGTPTFGLWVESMAKFECPGFGIDASVALLGGRIEVTILGVQRPSPCVGDSATAKQFIPLGHLDDGTYPFSLSLRDVIVNNGTLRVENGRYVLSLPNAQGVEVQNYVLEHLPDGIIWGYAATPDEPSMPIADNFLTDLKTLTAENDLAPGFYSYFTISGTGVISLHGRIAPEETASVFVRRLLSSPDSLKGLLQNYRNAQQQPLTVKCWTTGGEL